jgi:Small-conductance mechanosensitive channel
LERPFRTGDWVKIGDYDEGKVIDITWRSTLLQTRNDCILNTSKELGAEISFKQHFNNKNEKLADALNKILMIYIRKIVKVVIQGLYFSLLIQQKEYNLLSALKITI